MQHKLINTGYYLLIVDDSEIKSYYYDFFINKLKHSRGAEYAKSDIAKQVIAHLPLNNSPILEGVDLLPSLEDQHKDQLLKAVLYSTNRETVMSTLNNIVKMPVGFECEVEDVKMLKNRAGGVTYFGKPKTITNSQGLTQWVGEYIY